MSGKLIGTDTELTHTFGVSPRGLLIYDGTRIKLLDLAGHVRTISTPKARVVGLASADGQTIVYGEDKGVAFLNRGADGARYHSQVFTEDFSGSNGAEIVDTTSSHGWITPVRVTSQGVLTGSIPTGIGGSGPYIDEGYQTLYARLLDSKTGALTKINSSIQDDASCRLQDVEADGSNIFMCSHYLNPGHNSNATVEVTLSGHGRVTYRVPPQYEQAGTARFTPDKQGAILSVSNPNGTTGDGQGIYGYDMLKLDFRTGIMAPFGETGMHDVEVLPSGEVIAQRSDPRGGSPGIYLLGATGKLERTLVNAVPLLGGYWEYLGLIRAQAN